MIEQSVAIHDRHQIEIKIAYKLDEFAQAENLSLYFFLPASLGITAATYAKQEFFNDLVDYVRIKTPVVPLRDIAGGVDSPLQIVEAAIKTMGLRAGTEEVAAYERQLRMFCCILKSALRDHAALLARRPDAGDREDIVEQFLVQVRGIASGFRALRSLLNVSTVTTDVFAKFLFADEFVSLVIESCAYAVLQALRTSGGGHVATHQGPLLELVRSEIAYRRQAGYPSIPDEADDNELLLFRRSALKKYVESVLFLTTHSRRTDSVVEQTIFAVAAGLSMVFATAIAFVSQRLYGSLTLPFFVALVVSYMFKDRLKSVLRAYLSARVRRVFFDRRQHMYDGSEAAHRVGTCRESFDFVQEDRLPLEIRRLRNRDHITEVENAWLGETVFLYQKQVHLSSRWFKRMHGEYRIDGVTNILRMNVSRFLHRMDDPQKQLWICDDAGYREISGERVYHINMVVQSQSAGARDQQRYRIVLNKDGIKRIEPTDRAQAVVRSVSASDDEADI